MARSGRSVTSSPRWPTGTCPHHTALRELALLTWLPVGAVIALLALSVLAPAAATASAVPIAAIGALVGIPHGAVDHLLPWWWGPVSTRRTGLSRTSSSLTAFVLGYAGVAAIALSALLLAPTPTLVVFLVVSAVHFGRGEVLTSAERAGRPAPSQVVEWPVAAAHGLVVVGLLLWARPTSTDPVVRSLSPWLADAALHSRGIGMAVVGASVVVALWVQVAARRRREAVELALLWLMFMIAPPLAAFGVYFGAWHAVRHTGRLLDLARRYRVHRGFNDLGWAPAAALLGRSSCWPSLAAVVTVAVLWWARDLASVQAEVSVLLALTFPHTVVVWALDRRAAAGAR